MAQQVGLSQGRCQNLTQEPWWSELLAWAGRQAWGNQVLAAAVARVSRCLRDLPLESPEGLQYTRMTLQANGLLEGTGAMNRRFSHVKVNVGTAPDVASLSDGELVERLAGFRLSKLDQSVQFGARKVLTE